MISKGLRGSIIWVPPLILPIVSFGSIGFGDGVSEALESDSEESQKPTDLTADDFDIGNISESLQHRPSLRKAKVFARLGLPKAKLFARRKGAPSMFNLEENSGEPTSWCA